jgi:hypothetical protein
MSDRLAKLEAQIEGFVEGSLTRLLAGRLQARELAVRLARAMEDNARPGPRDSRLAPTHYHVRLNPEDEAAIRSQAPDLTDSLSAELVIFARELGLAFPGQPVISIEPDPGLEPHDVFVTAANARLAAQTRPMPAVSRASRDSSRAYLIVDAERHVPLNRPVVTLGRKLDNTIIVDDPRVSRHHAQLRLRYNRWVLYDLGSASGTFVNNHRIDECLLQGGDVISLAGVTLIYAEEDSTFSDGDTGGTLPLRADPSAPTPRRE